MEALADKIHNFGDIAASLSSGSYKTVGMVVIPCSMKTLDDVFIQTVNRVFDVLDIELNEGLFRRWRGPPDKERS